MKREVCCEKCARDWLRGNGIKVSANGTVPVEQVFALAEGETIKQVRGPLLHDARCDGCNAEMDEGAPAVAVSLYSRSIPYFEWEAEHVGTPVNP